MGNSPSKNLIGTIRSFQDRIAKFRWLLKNRHLLQDAQLRMILEHPPWESIQLTKTERKGKTPEQIQELRKQKYQQEVQSDVRLH